MRIINKDFKYDGRNPIIKALAFGASVGKKTCSKKELERMAKEHGLHLVGEDEYQEFSKWKNDKK